MTKLYLDIDEVESRPNDFDLGSYVRRKSMNTDRTTTSDKLWQLEKTLINGHHYIKLSDALDVVSQKKLDQKL